MSDQESKSEVKDMEDDNIDLAIIEEVESSGDPKRDKVCIIDTAHRKNIGS